MVPRLRWAEELTASGDDGRRATGRAILNELAGSTMATDEDVQMIRAMSDLSDVAGLVAMVSAQPVDAGDIVEDTGEDETEEPT